MKNIVGTNCIISKSAKIGQNIYIGHNCIIEDDVVIGDNCYIDNNTTIRRGVILGEDSCIGANCIIGEYQMDFWKDKKTHLHPLHIGSRALIRSGTIIYNGSEIGTDFQTGHQVNIREKTKIGNHVSIGTLSDVQGDCSIGDYVRMHSNVHVGMKSVIEDFVWIFPYVVLTNDPTPPSEVLQGVTLKKFSVIATGSVLLPGITVEGDSLVAAGAIVTKDVAVGTVVGGNPAKVISTTDKIKNKYTKEPVYPWREHFKRGMPWENSDYETWQKHRFM